MPKRDERLLLQDIYESGLKILRYTHHLSFDAFQSDEKTVDAVIRNFAVIGVAARNLSKAFIGQNPHIPWREIISYRNLLIHEHFGVNLGIILGRYTN